MSRMRNARQLAVWSVLAERGECTCEARAIALGLVKDRDDPVPIDPNCEEHGYLLGGAS